MPRRPIAVSVSLLLALTTACSPAPRWLAVAAPADSAVLLFDAHLRPIGRLAVPAAPAGLETTGDGASLLVAAETGDGRGMLVWLRRTGGAPVAARSLPGPPRDLALAGDGRRVFALVDGPLAELTIRGADDLEELRAIPVCARPRGLAITREGDRAYVTCAPGAVAEIDLRLGLLVRTGLVGADSGAGCGAGRGALSPDGTLLYLPCAASGRLLYLDRVTLRPWDSLAIGTGASSVTVARDGAALVLFPDSDRVVLADLHRRRPVTTLATPPNPVDVVLSAGGDVAFVLTAGRDSESGWLIQWHTRAGTIDGRVAVPRGSRRVYIWPHPATSRMYWVAAPR